MRARSSAVGTTSSRSRRATAAALIVIGAPALVGCGAGFDAQTNQVYQPAAGINDRSGDVYVLNALVVTDGSGYGTVSASLVNKAAEDDALVEVQASLTDGTELETNDLGAGIELFPQELVRLADEGAVRISSSETALEPDTQEEAGGITPGSFVSIVFLFERGDTVELNLPVVNSTLEGNEYYDDIPIGPPAEEQAAG